MEIFGGSRLPKLIVTNKSNNLSIFWHIPSLGSVGSRIYKYNIFHLQVWLTDLHLHDEVTVSVRKFSSNSLGWHWVTLTHTQDWHKYLKITQIHLIWFSDHLWSLRGHEGRFHWGRRSGFCQIFLKCQCLRSTLPTAVNPEFPEFEIWGMRSRWSKQCVFMPSGLGLDLQTMCFFALPGLDLQTMCFFAL